MLSLMFALSISLLVRPDPRASRRRRADRRRGQQVRRRRHAPADRTRRGRIDCPPRVAMRLRRVLGQGECRHRRGVQGAAQTGKDQLQSQSGGASETIVVARPVCANAGRPEDGQVFDETALVHGGVRREGGRWSRWEKR